MCAERAVGERLQNGGVRVLSDAGGIMAATLLFVAGRRRSARCGSGPAPVWPARRSPGRAPRVPGLAQVLGDDGRAAEVDQEWPAEVELRLLGRPGRERLAGAGIGILTGVAGFGVPACRGVRHR